MRIGAAAVVLVILTCATAAWSAPDMCPGVGGPLAGAFECDSSSCDSGVGSALVDIAVEFCNLGILPAECGKCECCRKPQVDLFAGMDVVQVQPNPDAFCNIGGRGQAIGEAALCLLRDLAQPAMGSPGPGIQLSRSGSLVIGDLKVKQHVGFRDFDPSARRMRGFHSVSFCAPGLGCLFDLTQPFTATLVQVNGGLGDCGGYNYTSPSWVLRVDSEQLEQNVAISVGPVSIYTPVGEIKVTPSFGYEFNLEAVTAPWASAEGRLVDAPCSSSDEDNVSTAAAGVFVTIIAAGDSGLSGGWNAALGLGGRDPNPEGALWAPPPPTPGLFPARPDFDFTIARSELEKRPTGRFVTAAEARYPLGDLVPGFDVPPLELEKLDAYVVSTLDAAVSSQFALVLDEAKGSLPLLPDCQKPRSQTGVHLQSAVDALATISVKAGADIQFALHLVFKTIRFRFNPETTVIMPTVVSESLVSSPPAEATIRYTNAPPPGPATYSSFVSFSAGPGDGRTFVDQCLSQPPPPPQQMPEPSAEPGDPLDIVGQEEFPCNICLYFPGSVSQVCAPRAGVPDDYFCPPAINGMPCTDPNCENITVSPPQAVNLKQVLFPASQAGLPSDKQWVCDAFEKFGCFDLCSYDPNAAQPLTLTQSAVDRIGTRCRDATGGGEPSKNGLPCQGDSICDDGNPCTQDRCVGTGEFGTCQITPSNGPCDDGLFCNGTDSCALGICGAHSGNPCSAGGACCNEATDTCPASCPQTPCEGKQAGASCDDGNACTTGEICIASPAGLLCRGDAALSCPASTCLAGICEEVQSQPQCTAVPSGACPPECGDGGVDAGEDCDGAADAACPGLCRPDCSCPPPQFDNGEPCTAPGECLSGFCADAVCCSTACDAPLEQCNLPGTVGTCASVSVPAPLLQPLALVLALLALVGVAALGGRFRAR